MKKLLGLAFLLLSITAASPSSAQTFGEIFPVTNTRYGTAAGRPRLATNGRDFLLFWSSERKIRATSLAQDSPRVGHVVLDTSTPFDVAWTGEVFLAASSRLSESPTSSSPATFNIIGRVLDAEARPLGGELTLAEHGREPRIAAGPEAIVMVYRGMAFDARVLVLGPRGESTGAESWRLPVGGSYVVAGNEGGFLIVASNGNGLRAIALDRKGRVVSERWLARPTGSVGPVALATDGNRYLTAWIDLVANEVRAVLVDENGSFHTPLVIHEGHASSPSAVWTGSGWSVSYESSPSSTSSRTRVAHLDRSARTILAEEESAVAGAYNPTLAAVNERTMAAWNPAQYAFDVSAVVELPLAAHEPRVATFSATQQTLLATASSADATLMVWREISEDGSAIHTGVRKNDGRWIERELATDGDIAVAASDGNQFVVITGNYSQELFRLDENGRPLAPAVKLQGYDTAIAWNGTHYGIVSDREGRLLTPSGVLSAPVAIPIPDSSAFSGKLALASNGDGFLLVGEQTECPFILCYSAGLNAVMLTAGLQRIDAQEISLDADFGILAGAVWNGTEYVVAWQASDTGIHTARVSASAGSPVTIARPLTDIAATSIASMPDGTIAIAGISNPSRGRVAVLRSDGSIAQTFDVDSSSVVDRPLLTTVPGGIAYVASSVQDAAPHHGTSHVMMAIARPSVIPPPAAPHVSARLKDGFILVDWSPSAGTLNGYRLEYRVDGGSWNELEEWFSAGSRHRTIRPSFGTNFEIRMRAFNDGGASAYSATALTKPIRRRAAGH